MVMVPMRSENGDGTNDFYDNQHSDHDTATVNNDCTELEVALTALWVLSWVASRCHRCAALVTLVQAISRGLPHLLHMADIWQFFKYQLIQLASPEAGAVVDQLHWTCLSQGANEGYHSIG